ncbi:MAG: NHLP bacteriocin system secretion protein [Spirochaetaceae bacterium]|nr:NHLP bacteriocin system secretion protein [Spirochaetaceae bacterium]
MAKELFRKVVLERMSSPEQLDQTIKVIKPGSWMALLGIVLFLAAVIGWSIIGTIPDKVLGQGVLLNSGQLYTINSPTTGLIKNVFVRQGDSIKNGQIIARLERTDLLDQIQLAQQQLEDLREAYRTLMEFNQGNLDLTEATAQKSQANLQQQIAVLYQQRKSLAESVGKLRELYEEGLVTEQQMMNSESQLSSLDVKIKDSELSLSDFKIKKFQATGEVAKQFLALEQDIEESERRIEILQISYRDQTKVTANREGMIVEVSVEKGDYISVGSSIAKMEPKGSGIKNIQAVLYFNARDGKKIERGMNIGISPSTVKQQEYGYILGIVTEVSAFPVSNQFLMRTFRHEGLVNMFSRGGTPIEVKADLIPDLTTISNFKWSSSRGPDITIESGLIATGSVTVREQSPLSLVLPILKKKILGIGEEDELLMSGQGM